MRSPGLTRAPHDSTSAASLAVTALDRVEVRLLFLLLSLAWGAPEPTVTLRGDTWARLLPEAPVLPTPPPARVVHWDVRLCWDGEAVQIQASWTVHTDRPEWVAVPLFGPRVHIVDARWNGERAHLLAQSGTRATGWVDGTVIITVQAVLPGDPTKGPLPLTLGAATSGEVRLEVPPGLRGTVRAPGGVALPDRLLTGADVLIVQVGLPAPRARDRSLLATATTGLGLTVGEASIEGRARMTWALRRGRLDRVTFTARGIGDDLEVKGAQVASWSWSADRVEVVLKESERALIALDLSFSVPLPQEEASSISLPELTPVGVARSEATVQIAREAEIEVVPELTGWEAISSLDLPEYGEGLVAGAPTAAFRVGAGARSGSLSLLRYVPAAQPAVMVDVASHVVAVAQDGRVLSRVLLTTRNERAPFLRVSLPPGHRVISARVDGEATNLIRGADGLQLPLPRSLETLEGLISFPIELVTLGEGQAWAPRERRALSVLAVDAPVAVSRVSVHLPPSYRNKLQAGEWGVVEDFTEGETLAYGFGLGGGDEARADALWQEAMGRYMSNEFDEAEALLSELQALGAANQNLDKLRANIDVVQGRGDAASDRARDVQVRRVVAQAASRGLDDYRAQRQAQVEAKREEQAGNYLVAEEKYREVEELARKLRKVEQAESVEQARAAMVSEERRRAAREIWGSVEREAPAGEGDPQGSDGAAIEGEPTYGDLDGVAAGSDALPEPSPPPASAPTPRSDPNGGILDPVTGTFSVNFSASARTMPGRARTRSPARSRPDTPRESTEQEATRGPSRRLNRRVPVVDREPESAADVDLDDSGFEKLQVTSTAESVVVPVLGQTVRYQHLLLPAGAEHAVRIEARAPRSSVQRDR